MSQEIEESDWLEIKELASEIANASLGLDPISVESLRIKLLDRLSALEEKYGESASILGVVAEYLELPSDKLALFEKAYLIADRQKDHLNKTLISHSIAELYVLDFKDAENGRMWLGRLESNLKDHFSSYEAGDLLSLRSELEQIN